MSYLPSARRDGIKFDRLVQSLRDPRAIADGLYAALSQAQPRRIVHNPTDPASRLLFNVLAIVAEFEADLIRMRTREGMKVANAKGRLRSKQPELSPKQGGASRHAVPRRRSHAVSELEELFPVTRSTIYRAIAGSRALARPPDERGHCCGRWPGDRHHARSLLGSLLLLMTATEHRAKLRDRRRPSALAAPSA